MFSVSMRRLKSVFTYFPYHKNRNFTLSFFCKNRLDDLVCFFVNLKAEKNLKATSDFCLIYQQGANVDVGNRKVAKDDVRQSPEELKTKKKKRKRKKKAQTTKNDEVSRL